MDNFENQDFPMEEGYTQPQQPRQEPYVGGEEYPRSQPYSGAGAGRRESPYADSPYVTHHQNQYRYQSEPVPPAEPPKAKKKKKGALKSVLAAVLAVALVVGSCVTTAALVNNRWEKKTEQMMSSVQEQMRQMQQQIGSHAAAGNSISGTVQLGEGLSPAQVYARNVQSVVLINCTVTSSYYGQPVSGASAGSGFVLTEDGYVVTNCHVVEGATSISVTMYDGTEYPAQLIGSDATNDLAVLKMEAEGLQAVTLGSSDDLIVGDQVVAIGNPLGELTSTMTVGYVSAKDRDVTTDGTTINMIQTDAAINSGNSGGPMFNMRGEVIGITTAKYSGASSSGASIEGIGFAIPMDDVVGMISDLIDYGYVTGAYLGVMVSDMNPDTASYYGMPVGAYVEEVTPGYCAEAAGVHAKDIIVAIGDIEVASVSQLTRALREFKPGDTTTLTVYRGGAERVLEVTLDEKPQTTTEPTIPAIPEGGNMPNEGDFEEWYNYLYPFFGNGQG